MKFKDISEVRSDILQKYEQYLPNLDLTEGTPERDIFVEAPLEGLISPLWEYSVYVAKLHAPHTYYYELDDTDIDNYIDTYQVAPLAATYSSGSCTFFTYNQPTKDIIIGTGTVVTTNTNPPVEFVTISTAIIYFEKHLSYYNVSKERWEIGVNVRAQKSGPEYRAGKNTVTRIASSLSGIDGCTNDSTIMGGTEAETTESKLRKVIQKFQGRDISSTSGVESYIKNLSSTANVVWASSPLMERDGGLGGAIDIYLIDNNDVTTSDSLSITSAGLSIPINTNYTTTSIVIKNQPVSSLISFIRNNVIVDSTKYELTKDSGLLKKSTRSSDKLTLIPTHGYQVWGFSTQVTESSPTGLANDVTKYGFRVSVNGAAPQSVTILGNTAQTIKDLCAKINELTTGLTCTFDSYDLFIKVMSDTTGASSTISILDGGVVGQDQNLFSSVRSTNELPTAYLNGEDVVPFADGDKLEITYLYNAALLSIENLLYNEANHYHGRDYLAREMDEVEINLYCRFKEVAGQDFDSIKLSVESAFTSIIDQNKTKNVIELADVITSINQVNGVSNLDIASMVLTSTGGGSKAGTDIYTGSNQYMVSGTVDIQRWTS